MYKFSFDYGGRSFVKSTEKEEINGDTIILRLCGGVVLKSTRREFPEYGAFEQVN